MKKQAAAALALMAITAAPALAQTGPRPDEIATYFDHNGSVLRVSVSKQGRVVMVFAFPKTELIPFGVTRESPFFLGEQIGPFQLAGTAKLYSRHCPPASYTLRGHFSSDGNVVTLNGNMPAFADRFSCRLVYTAKVRTITLHRIERREAFTAPPPKM